MGRAMVVGETIEDVILVMVCSCLEKMAQRTGMGLIISDPDSRAFYPLFPSTELRISITTDIGTWISARHLIISLMTFL